jgi:hypothetical protein
MLKWGYRMTEIRTQKAIQALRDRQSDHNELASLIGYAIGVVSL